MWTRDDMVAPAQQVGLYDRRGGPPTQAHAESPAILRRSDSSAESMRKLLRRLFKLHEQRSSVTTENVEHGKRGLFCDRLKATLQK